MANTSVTAASALVVIIASGAAEASHSPDSSSVFVQPQANGIAMDSKETQACLKAGFEAAQQDALALNEILLKCGLHSVDIDPVELMQVSGGSQF